MTNLETLANEFKNENLRNLFIDAFKNCVNTLIYKGADTKTANRLAFDFLIKDNGFERILNKVK